MSQFVFFCEKDSVAAAKREISVVLRGGVVEVFWVVVVVVEAAGLEVEDIWFGSVVEVMGP